MASITKTEPLAHVPCVTKMQAVMHYKVPSAPAVAVDGAENANGDDSRAS